MSKKAPKLKEGQLPPGMRFGESDPTLMLMHAASVKNSFEVIDLRKTINQYQAKVKRDDPEFWDHFEAWSELVLEVYGLYQMKDNIRPERALEQLGQYVKKSKLQCQMMLREDVIEGLLQIHVNMTKRLFFHFYTLHRLEVEAGATDVGAPDAGATDGKVAEDDGGGGEGTQPVIDQDLLDAWQAWLERQ